MMRAMGLILIVLGLAVLLYGGLTLTSKEKVIDLGPVEVTRDKKHSLPNTPLLGMGAVLVGGVVLIAARRS